MTAKKAWFEARKKLRRLCEDDPDLNLFFHDSLAKVNRDLFWRTRKAAKEKGFKFCWVKGGKILTKKDENASLIRVNRESDIKKIA